MPVLYGRSWRFIAGPQGSQAIDFKELRVVFKIERSHKPEANAANFDLYNLSRASRSHLEGENIVAKFEAGFIGARPLISRGGIERVTQRKTGSEIVTVLEADDGSSSMNSAIQRISMRAGTKLVDAFKTASVNLGVGLGNALESFSEGNFGRGMTEYANGVVLTGTATEIMNKLTSAAGVEWSVQDEQLVITKKGEPLPSQAVVLSPTTGLVGSPQSGEGGRVKAQALIQPGLDPARKVRILSETIDGFFRIESVSYNGDTHGPTWFADLECKPI